MDPKRAIRELMYRYTFSSDVAFCSFLTQASPAAVKYLFEECSQQACFRKAEEIVQLSKPGPGRGQMGQESRALYVLIRLIKPGTVLETGVGAGISSLYMLQAMVRNGKGRLYSIDLPDETELTGWVVPDDLKSHWDLRIGSSCDILPVLLEEISHTDIFLHDSDHSYDHMMFEFRTIWPYLKNNGLFLAHDIGRNKAIFDFCRESGISWANLRTYIVLGGFLKI